MGRIVSTDQSAGSVTDVNAPDFILAPGVLQKHMPHSRWERKVLAAALRHVVFLGEQVTPGWLKMGMNSSQE